MDKAYIMLENSISGMGGGQMYARNKLTYMSDLDWCPFVFYGVDGKIIISDFEKFNHFYFPILISAPTIYSKGVKNKQINKFVSLLNEFDLVVIESGSGHMALWGELIAEKLQCKHMIHLLDERNDLTVPEGYLDFYRFKLERRELSGINNKSLKMLFRNSDIITDKNCYELSSVCQNVVLDIDTQIELNASKYDYVIGCIGRLEKGYVLETAKAFSKVASKHKDKKILAVFIGGDSEGTGKIDELKKILDKNENLESMFLGFLYPIPLKLLKEFNLFVSSAGSAGVSYRVGIPTISVDSCDLKAIGVLGYSTVKALTRDNEPLIEIDELIEKVLFSDYLTQFSYIPARQVDLNVLATHVEFMKSSVQDKKYYNVNNLLADGKDKMKKKLCTLCGAKLYVKFYPKLLKLMHKSRNDKSGK